MSDYYFTIEAGNRRALCISPLTRDELTSEGAVVGDGLGYYLYERDEQNDGLTILAEVGSADAAVQLYRLLNGVAAARRAAA